MAYSRWSTSVWYVYWRIPAPICIHKHQEILACHHSEDAEEEPKTLSFLEVEQFIKKPNWDLWKHELTDIEKDELIERMQEWLKDVAEKWKNKKSKKHNKKKFKR